MNWERNWGLYDNPVSDNRQGTITLNSSATHTYQLPPTYHEKKEGWAVRKPAQREQCGTWTHAEWIEVLYLT